jgi:hypothetical protein
MVLRVQEHREVSALRRYPQQARIAAAALFALGLLALAGCSSSGPPKPCPRVGVLDEAQRLVRFSEGAGRDLTDVRFEAEIGVRAGRCEYTRKDSRLEVEIAVEIQAVRAPNAGRRGEFEYFVAITDRAQRVVERQSFTAVIPFEADRRSGGALEELSQTIPLKPNQLGNEFEIIVGFALSPDELAYNRRLRGR